MYSIFFFFAQYLPIFFASYMSYSWFMPKNVFNGSISHHICAFVKLEKKKVVNFSNARVELGNPSSLN